MIIIIITIIIIIVIIIIIIIIIINYNNNNGGEIQKFPLDLVEYEFLFKNRLDLYKEENVQQYVYCNLSSFSAAVSDICHYLFPK